MSIINDFKAINEAMQPARAARSNGRPICYKCWVSLDGALLVESGVACAHCNAINRVEE